MKYLKFGLKVIAIFALISAGYFFGYLKPHQTKVERVSAHYSNLVQNRTAYINLAKLDPESADFDIQKSNLIDIIKATNAEGLANPSDSDEKRILKAQNTILDRVFKTTSYSDGVAILKSEESVKFLKELTSLIEEYKKMTD